jgi:carbon monoxide dehydrogenase subunit G
MTAVTISRTRSVPTQPADVWAVLADFDSISTWASNVNHSCLLTEQVGDVGTVRRIQSGRVTVRETVVTWHPEHKLCYSIAGLPSVVSTVTNTWTLTASGEGTTVTLMTEITPGPRPPHRVVARVLSRVMARTSDQMLADLVAHLTAGVRP